MQVSLFDSAAPSMEAAHIEEPTTAPVTPPQVEDMPELKVIVRQGRDGWKADTETEYKGQQYNLSTYKGYRGDVVTTLNKVHRRNSGTGFQVTEYADMMSAPTINRVTAARVTRQVIEAAHAEALEKFRAMIRAGQIEEAPEGLKVGQVVKFDGYGHYGTRGLVVKVSGDSVTWIVGGSIHTDTDRHLHAFGSRQGIGTYYTEEFKPAEVAARYYALAKARRARIQREEQEKADQEGREKREAIERGRAIITEVPGWAKACLVGILKEDTSDSQQDYWGHNTVKTVVLAFSSHDRDLFPEMREAAGRCEETKHLQTEGEEHREKYSMGRGYYLAEGYHSGWEVRKGSIESLEYYQEKAGRGEFFADLKQSAPAPAAEPGSAPADQVGTVQIIDYSEKAIAVIGDTKPLKDVLGAMRGRFNYHLSCGPGWIFPKTALERVKAGLKDAVKSAPAASAGDACPDPGELAAESFCQENNI